MTEGSISDRVFHRGTLKGALIFRSGTEVYCG